MTQRDSAGRFVSSERAEFCRRVVREHLAARRRQDEVVVRDGSCHSYRVRVRLDDLKGREEVSDALRFIYTPPREVEAMQWQPDDEESTKATLWWLTRRGATFQVGPSDDGSLWVLLRSKRGNFDEGANETDWIVRESSDAFSVWSDPTFRANYRPDPEP